MLNVPSILYFCYNMLNCIGISTICRSVQSEIDNTNSIVI